ncbi:MAG: hypothetical protein H7Y17_02460 [Chlorobia bacterium]|nr:hypothetical protein [Fimbriimonadaceae bacterium]
MNALDLIAYNTQRQLDRFFEAFHAIPADKQDWAPNAASRSALDQLQEVAVVFQGIADAVTERKLVMTDEDFANYTAERKMVSDPAQLEKMTREGTVQLIAFMGNVKESELEETVEMPWPGDFRVADLLGYHSWNMAYHEGQINYIAGLLAEG